MYQIVFVRHGESVWNHENRFTGWTDVDLTDKGNLEAKEAGRILKIEGYVFDIAYSSVLKRAIKTLHHIQEEMDLFWIPVQMSWKLNERHYGGLQGLNKTETAKKYGEEQVKLWRRSYDILPPLITKDDKRWPGNDKMYGGVTQNELPFGESLKETIDRVIPYWKQEIIPNIVNGKSIIVVAHGNSLRALIKHIEAIDNKEILNLNIPTGIPLVYKLNSQFKMIEKRYLGNNEKIQAEILKVSNQSKKQD